MSRWNLDGIAGSLLTVSGNPKVDKGTKYGYHTAIMHLAPHKAAGNINTCAFASAGCAAACLNLAGRGGMALDDAGLNGVQVARIQRTRMFKRDRAAFLLQLHKEITTHVRRATKHDLIPAIRLNGTSDLPWERFEIMEAFPDVQFYDYTKYPISKRSRPDNYHLTFSMSEDNDDNATIALESGVNVAVVLDVARHSPLPADWTFKGEEYPVIDGDVNDLRFLDPIREDGKGLIVGLRAKGFLKTRAEGVRDGFVRLPFPSPIPAAA